MNSKLKSNRLATIRMLISSREMSSQNDVLEALKKEGYDITQATLSRDFKRMKVAKAATIKGNYVYVLPSETMYHRVNRPAMSASQLMNTPGFLSINFSGNMGVIKTRPGYASSIAYNIDNTDIPEILGTIAGDDTIFIALREGVRREEVIASLKPVIPNIQ